MSIYQNGSPSQHLTMTMKERDDGRRLPRNKHKICTYVHSIVWSLFTREEMLLRCFIHLLFFLQTFNYINTCLLPQWPEKCRGWINKDALFLFTVMHFISYSLITGLRNRNLRINLILNVVPVKVHKYFAAL